MIDISLLLSNVKKEIVVDQEIIYSEEYYENTDIINIKPVLLNGIITKMNTGQLILNLTAKVELTLPCAITLEPVKYPFTITIDQIIDEKDENNLKKDENTLELKEFLWENIVVEIPLRVVSENAYNKVPSGDGWKLITEEDNNENKINSSFEVLNQLIDKE